MIFVPDILTVFLGFVTLLFLGLHTLSKCRSEGSSYSSEEPEFLFQGKSRIYSLASSVGATFSVSYYGATVIYGHLFKGWFLAILVAANSAATVVVLWVLREGTSDQARHGRGNILLEIFKERLSKRSFAGILRTYCAIYFLLLVEELAVARLAISTLFPKHPIIHALLLATICLIVLAYVRWGGYRAVLISDLEQLKLIAPFLLALVFFLYSSPPELASMEQALRLNHMPSRGILLFSLVFVVGWVASPLDFYSRLNFAPDRRSSFVRQRKRMALLALLFSFFSYFIGGLFGAFLPPSFSKDLSPTGFTEAGISFILENGTPLISVVFFASLFFMIFTTCDTLLLTVVQVGHYQNSRLIRLGNLGRLMLVAVALSCFLPMEAVSLVGVFLASLMMLPLLATIGTLAAAPGARPLFHSAERLDRTLALTALAVGVLVATVPLDFFGYFLLPGVVVGCFSLHEAAVRVFGFRKGGI